MIRRVRSEPAYFIFSLKCKKILDTIENNRNFLTSIFFHARNLPANATMLRKRLLQDHKKYNGIQRNERSSICARSGTGEISKMLVKIIIFVQDEVMHKYN
jgi:hypothetical protein